MQILNTKHLIIFTILKYTFALLLKLNIIKPYTYSNTLSIYLTKYQIK